MALPDIVSAACFSVRQVDVLHIACRPTSGILSHLILYESNGEMYEYKTWKLVIFYNKCGKRNSRGKEMLCYVVIVALVVLRPARWT